MVIFSIPLTASMMLRREKSRLKPWRGLMRLNFGRMDSPATSIFVWKKVTPTASTAVTAKNGAAIVKKESTVILKISFIMVGIVSGAAMAI